MKGGKNNKEIEEIEVFKEEEEEEEQIERRQQPAMSSARMYILPVALLRGEESNSLLDFLSFLFFSFGSSIIKNSIFLFLLFFLFFSILSGFPCELLLFSRWPP